MSLEVFGVYREENSIEEQCKKCISYHATIVMNDGSMVDGIIEGMDNGQIIVLVGEDVVMDESSAKMNRQPPGGYNRPNRYRRFRRRNYPIGGINRIGFLPYPLVPPIYPYGYPNPYYPYY